MDEQPRLFERIQQPEEKAADTHNNLGSQTCHRFYNQPVSLMAGATDSMHVASVVSSDWRPLTVVRWTALPKAAVFALSDILQWPLSGREWRVTLRAPDGMVIDGSAINRPSDIPQTRAERIKAGMKAEVPQRVQQGPTCGLYALGMVMDFWHQADKQNPTVLVSDKDIGGKGRNYNDEPTSDERMLSYVREAGYTAAGEMFKARDLAETAAHFGYKAHLYQDATLQNLYDVLDAGHPARGVRRRLSRQSGRVWWRTRALCGDSGILR